MINAGRKESGFRKNNIIFFIMKILFAEYCLIMESYYVSGFNMPHFLDFVKRM